MKKLIFSAFVLFGLIMSAQAQGADLNYVAAAGKSSALISVDTKALTGTAPFTFQWRKAAANSANFADIVGATNPTYLIPVVGVADAGTYLCVVKNSAGSVNTNNNIISVSIPAAVIIPGNANATTIITPIP